MQADYAGYESCGNQGIILKKGENGLEKIYDLEAYDPESGEAIPSYSMKTDLKETVREKEDEERLYFNLEAGPVQILEAKTVYEADDSLAYGEKERVRAPENGSAVSLSFYEGEIGSGTPEVKQIITKDVVDEIIRVGTNETREERDVPFKTVYKADKTRELGSGNVVSQEGQKGVSLRHYRYEVDEEGNTHSPVLVSEDVKTPPVDKIIQVPVVETRRTVLPFGTEYELVDDKWDNWKSEVSGGKDGYLEEYFKYPVNPETGKIDAGNGEELKDALRVEPVNAKVQVGAKKPNWVPVKSDTTVTDVYNTVKKLFISPEEFETIHTQEDVVNALKRFNQTYEGHKAVGTEGYVVNEGQNAISETYYLEAQDEHGNPIEGYEHGESYQKKVQDLVDEVQMYFNISFAGTREVVANTVYKADSSLPYGETRVVQKAVNGEEAGVKYYDGEIGTVSPQEKWYTTKDCQPGEIHVGNVKTETEEIPFGRKTIQLPEENEDGYPDGGWDDQYYPVTLGEKGLRESTVTYKVDPNTGLTDEIESSIENRVIKEPVDEVYGKGAHHFTNRYLEDYEKELWDLINEYRAENGVAPIRWDEGRHKLAQKAAAECSVNGFQHPGVADKNITWNTTDPLAALEMWKSSPGHNANLLASDAKYGAIGWYWADDNGYYVAFDWQRS
mgnify:CR=1 FL=1